MSEIVFEVLCAEVLEALRGLGLGKFSIRNYYYEGMWPIISDVVLYRQNVYEQDLPL